MKNVRLIYLLCFALVFTGCEKIEVVKDVDVDVTVEDESYAKGEPVVFQFTGEADVISFYSGEIGHDYAYREGRIFEKDFLVNFETQRQNGSVDQGDQFQLFMSMDFDQDITFDNVNSYDQWEEITDKFTWAKLGNGATYILSGIHSIGDHIDYEKGAKLVFAIKQTVKNQNTYGLGGLNRLRGFTLKEKTYTTETQLFKHSKVTDWTLVSSPNKQPLRAEVLADLVMMRNSWPAEYLDYETYDWAVSIPIEVIPTVDMGPDRPIGIKSVANKMLTRFEYVYDTAGTYEVTFIIKNQNVTGVREKVITKTVTIHE